MELVQRQGKRHPASRAGNLRYVCLHSRRQRRWRWEEEEEEPEKTEVEFQIQNERRHKSKVFGSTRIIRLSLDFQEEEDENDKVAVGEELRYLETVLNKTLPFSVKFNKHLISSSPGPCVLPALVLRILVSFVLNVFGISGRSVFDDRKGLSKCCCKSIASGS
ncbi:hypothetical protein YC2023_053616 [Brassica napus]